MFNYAHLSVFTLFFVPALLSAQVGGLIDYWKFDCNLCDSATWDGGATGTIYNSAAYDPCGGGINGSAPVNYDNAASMNFAANKNSEVRLPQSLDCLTGVTISFWIYASTADFDKDGRAFSGGSSGQNQTLIWPNKGSGLNGFSFILRGSDCTFGRIDSGCIGADQWTHIVGRWDGCTMELIADNVIIGTLCYAPPSMVGRKGVPGNIKIGRDNAGGCSTARFDGNMDDIRIWNTALTDGEIANLAAGCHPLVTCDGSCSTDLFDNGKLGAGSCA